MSRDHESNQQQTRSRRNSEGGRKGDGVNRPTTFDDQFTSAKDAPSAQGSWRRRDENAADSHQKPGFGSAWDHRRDNLKDNSRERTRSVGNNQDRPNNNRGVRSPEKSKNNHLAGAREGEQRRGSLPSFPAQDFRLTKDDHDRRPTATKSGNSSPTHSGRTSPTSSGRTSPTMTRSKSTDFRQLNQDTSPESKGEGRRSRKNSRHHHRPHNDGIQMTFNKEYNKDTFGIIPCIKMEDPATKTMEWYMLLQVSFSAAKLNFKVDPFRGKREDPMTPAETVAHTLKHGSAGVFDITPEDLEKHAYMDDPSKLYFLPVEFEGGYESVQSIFSGYDSNLTHMEGSIDAEGMIVEQVKLIHKELNRRNNGRSKQMYNTLTKFPISSQIQAAAVCLMFNLPEIEKNKKPLTLSVQTEGNTTTARITNNSATPPIIPDLKSPMGTLFLEKVKKAREENDMITLLRPHLEQKLTHFPGDGPTVLQVTPVTNNFSAEETNKLKEMVENITRMTLAAH